MSPFNRTNKRTAVAGWFTPARRVALYAVALAILPILTRTGILTEETSGAWAIIVQAVLQVVAGILMLANLSFADAATWFARGGRAAIYSLGGFVAPALTTIGLFTSEQADFWLKLLSDLLAVAAALLAALYINPTPTPAVEQADGSFNITSLPDPEED